MADMKKFLDQSGVSTLWSRVAEKVAVEEARAKAAEAANAAAAAKAQSDVDALTEVVKTKAAQSDLTELAGKVEILEASGYDDTEVRELISGNADAIEAIEADYLKAADKTELSDAINEIANDYLKAADKAELQGNIDTLEGVVNTLADGIDADKVDGVKDLIAYVEEHGAEVTGMKDDISANAGAIEGILNGAEVDSFADVEAKLAGLQAKGDYSVVGHGHEIADVEGLQAALDAKAVKSEVESALALKADATALEAAVEALEGADATLLGKIEVLEGKFDGEGSVASLIATAKQEAIDAAATKANTAEANAKAYADGLAGNYDAAGAADAALVAAKAYTDVEAAKHETKGAAAQALVDAKQYTDTEFAKIVALTEAEIDAAIAAANKAE